MKLTFALVVAALALFLPLAAPAAPSPFQAEDIAALRAYVKDCENRFEAGQLPLKGIWAARQILNRGEYVGGKIGRKAFLRRSREIFAERVRLTKEAMAAGAEGTEALQVVYQAFLEDCALAKR